MASGNLAVDYIIIGAGPKSIKILDRHFLI